ncbi:MAG: DNA cytosine methyltransferase [Bacteroidetes bacterium]|nr:DNA cytosine methyltransferase [Bacteroidota bacterium]
MNHGSLFSGIGGFDLASEWMGWNNVFHCEINPFCKKVLKYYWPEAISYEDIKTTDFTIHRGNIDIITGGFPCQPYSLAGKRKGKEDERHLWPEMLRAIREIQPRWVVGENVFGLINWSGGLVFDEVQTDLEAAGYEIFPYVLPACAVNAPHRRDRIWFVAYCNGNGCITGNGENEINTSKRRLNALSNLITGIGDGDAANAESIREQPRQSSGPDARRFEQLESTEKRGDIINNVESGIITDSDKSRRKEFDISNFTDRKRIRAGSDFGYGSCWQDFPTQSPLCSRNDGLSSRLDGITFSKHRNESIKGYGNAIVPKVTLQIFKSIQEYESLTPINGYLM